MRFILAALAITALPSLALAQGGSGTPPPATAAPAAKTPGIGEPKGISEPKSAIPPAAQSGANRGLRYGEGAADGSPIAVKRNK